MEQPDDVLRYSKIPDRDRDRIIDSCRRQFRGNRRPSISSPICGSSLMYPCQSISISNNGRERPVKCHSSISKEARAPEDLEALRAVLQRAQTAPKALMKDVFQHGGFCDG